MSEPIRTARTLSPPPTGMSSTPKTPGSTHFGSSTTALLSPNDAERALVKFEQTCLSKNTNTSFIYVLKGRPDNRQPPVGEIELTDSNLAQAFLKLAPETTSAVCFITRNVVSQVGGKGEKRLAISATSFRWLVEHFSIPPSFVAALSHQFRPASWLSSIPETDVGDTFTCWYIIPVRVAVACTDGRTPHALSEAGSSQMDPSNYLHLEDTGHDIRPSMLAIFSLRGLKGGEERAVCINFQDGRWRDIVKEPGQRLKQVLESAAANRGEHGQVSCQSAVHLVLFSSAANWWSQALECFNRQVIEYEQQLIRGPPTAVEEHGKFHDEIHKSLHMMASHLHRYRAELHVSEQTFTKIKHSIQRLHEIETGKATSNLDANMHVLSTQLAGLLILTEELDAKVQTVLALVFHSKQMSQMQLLVANGQSLRSVMMSTRDEAKSSRKMAAESQAMARAMRKDSVSMKTLALVSVLFLPGGTFAAILSMPFFTDQEWIGEPAKVWLWFVLTIPATLVAMLAYIYFVRKGSGIQKEMDMEMERLGDNRGSRIV